MSLFFFFRKRFHRTLDYDKPFLDYYYDSVKKKYERAREEVESLKKADVQEAQEPKATTQPEPQIQVAEKSLADIRDRLGKLNQLLADIYNLQKLLDRAKWDALRQKALAEQATLKAKQDALRELQKIDEELLLTLWLN